MKEASVQRTYAYNAPRILLEVISARATLIILGATYVVFIAAFLYDVLSTLQNFDGGDRILPTYPCEDLNIDARLAWRYDGEWGCIIDSEDSSGDSMWIGRVNNITNVISIGLRYSKENITAISFYNDSLLYVDDKEDVAYLSNEMQEQYIDFSVSVYACFLRNGCRETGSDTQSSWHHVLTMIDRRMWAYELIAPDMKSVHLDVLGNTFQNQEALPTRSNVKSYLVFVQYTGAVSLLGNNQYDTGEYRFMSISRPRDNVMGLLRPILMGITIVTAVLYCRTLYLHSPNIGKWLHERKWIVFYFFALILYQNPVYCVICRLENPSSQWVFASYALDAFSQASFFLVWLLFSDGLRRKSHFYSFYIPKLVMCLLIFATNMGILVMQFPSVNRVSGRSPSLAVYNWSRGTKVMFIAFSLSFFSLLILWCIWWFRSLWTTASVLQKVPYMSTRYLQLSFRFFFLQATFVATYYILEYGVVIYLILRNSPPVIHQHLDNISDNINTLFRHQTLLVGKVVFLSVYSLILAFLFLPAAQVDSVGEAFHTLAATYTITEEEMEAEVKARRRIMSKQLALSNLAHTKAEVYCLSLAQQMLDASYEVYYDLPGIDTDSGFGPADWFRHGYSVIDHVYDKAYDTYCCIVRHNETNKVVVTFRGSCSAQHWQNNLHYGLKEVDLGSLNLPCIDASDGLDVAQYIELDNEDIESDDEEGNRGERKRDGSSNPVMLVADTLREVVGATQGAVVGATNTVVGATTGLITAAVARTPGINTTVKAYVHSGFWEAYVVAREFIHRTLRTALTESPAQVFFTGHSLGGALATFAALDFSMHSLTRVNKYIKYKSLSSFSQDLPLKLNVPRQRLVKVGMYNFGAPKVGNWIFAKTYDKIVPNSFRTVTDGDIVCGLPPTMSYFHIGTQVLIDPLGAGSIIIDPSFVERRLRTSVKSSISVHTMAVYRVGIDGILDASAFMQQHAGADDGSPLDRIDLAFSRDRKSWDSSWARSVDSSWHSVRGNKFERLSQSSVHSTGDLRDTTIDASEWGYTMDASTSSAALHSFPTNYSKDEENIDSHRHSGSHRYNSAYREHSTVVNPTHTDMDDGDCDRLDELSRITVDSEDESFMGFGADLARLQRLLSVRTLGNVLNTFITVPQRAVESVLVGTGVKTLDDEDMEGIVNSTVPRRVNRRIEPDRSSSVELYSSEMLIHGTE